MPYDFTHMWNLGNKTNEHKGKKRERQTVKDIQLQRVARERWAGGWVKQMMGIKESTCYGEHWVLYLSDASLKSVPETNITLYVT